MQDVANLLQRHIGRESTDKTRQRLRERQLGLVLYYLIKLSGSWDTLIDAFIETLTQWRSFECFNGLLNRDATKHQRRPFHCPIKFCCPLIICLDMFSEQILCPENIQTISVIDSLNYRQYVVNLTEIATQEKRGKPCHSVPGYDHARVTNALLVKYLLGPPYFGEYVLERSFEVFVDELHHSQKLMHRLLVVHDVQDASGRVLVRGNNRIEELPIVQSIPIFSQGGCFLKLQTAN
mmetsp:Transcript_18554/g.43395  ORF Transcript_18554/g.43395 Transcript_18554/m.43395 type:complete len:236 (-) Transcript_18554:2163-2870(-)